MLILTGLGAPGHLARALEARVGGFMRKDAPSDELADAIRRVADGRRFVDPDLVAAALEVGTNPLTERETDVLRAAAEGGSTEDIGAAAVPLARDRAQLPLQRDRQARRAQPDRRDPHRPRGRLDLRSAAAGDPGRRGRRRRRPTARA